MGSNGKGRLEGKTAIVTGGATGIGEAIVHKFAKEGARVVVAGLPEDPVDDVVASVKQHGGEALAVKCDVAKEGDARANVCAFLASDEASYVTGSLVFADGGTVIDKGGIGAKVPEGLRQQPEGHLTGLQHSRDGLEKKETVTKV